MKLIIKLLCITFIGYIYGLLLTQESFLSISSIFLFVAIIRILLNESIRGITILIIAWYIGYAHNNSYILPFFHKDIILLQYLKFFICNILANLNFIFIFGLYVYQYKGNGRKINPLFFLVIASLLDYYDLSLIATMSPSRTLNSFYPYIYIIQYTGLYIASIFTHLLIIAILDFYIYKKRNYIFICLIFLLILVNQLFKPNNKTVDNKTVEKELVVSVIQGKSFLESQRSRYFFNEITKLKDSDLIILPESAFSEYSIKSMYELQNQLPIGQMVIAGYKNSSAIILTKTTKQIIFKKIPFLVNENSKFSQMEAIYHRFINGKPEEQCFNKEDIKICLFICWESSFSTYISQFPKYDLAINITGDELLNEITKALSFKVTKTLPVLTKRPIIRASQGGSSGLYDENSHLVFKTNDNQHLTKTFTVKIKK